MVPEPVTEHSPGPAAHAVEVRNLCVSYGDVQALHGVSLSVRQAEFIGIAGANGAGKSTLLRAISGALKPRSGTIQVFGAQTRGWPTHRLARAGLVHVPEGRAIFSGLSVEDNLLSGAIGRSSARLGDVLEIFPHLKNKMRQAAGSLSGGEQQMVAIGRGLMSKPNLLMIDELSLGLAPKITIELYEKLVEYGRDQHCSMILVDQNLDLLRRFTGRIVILRSGRIAVEQDSKHFTDNESAIDAYLG
jgi:branched-chain amino acid transport system ATP-binding protein